MKLIQLSKGKVAKVDDELFDFLSHWRWHFDGKYARRNIRVNGELVHIYMHKVVAGFDGKVDHWDLDQLNNQKHNLRPCTTQTNAVNSKKAPNKSSTFKGVSKSGNRWRSQLTYNNKKVYDAMLPNERWAAMAADLNSYALFGEFTRRNFPEATLVCSLS